MIKVGEFYAFDYEKDRVKDHNFVWWECIEVRDEWAILYRMSKDYKGDPRPSVTPIEVTHKGLIRGTKLTIVYCDEFYINGSGQFRADITSEANALYKVGLNEDGTINYFQILPKK